MIEGGSPVFMGRIDGLLAQVVAKGSDVLDAIEGFCAVNSIDLAFVQVTGRLEAAVLGTYDQGQSVFAVEQYREDLEILSFSGIFAQADGRPHADLTAALARKDAGVIGGRVFGGTLAHDALFFVSAVSKSSFRLQYNEMTGLLGPVLE
ncbi:MAG: DNA-binding protein [Desulfatibacillaceae bacterium]|nr:DNA-binding protein [Desulfatibacillaceae bacterium]